LRRPRPRTLSGADGEIALADRVIYLEDGAVAYDGAPASFLASPPDCIVTDETLSGGARVARDPEKIADELAFDKKNFGTEDFLFWAEGFTQDMDYAKEIARVIIRRKAGIRWVCNGRVDRVDEEMLPLFKEAGCTMIGFGIESGVQEILDEMNKKTKVEQIRRAVDLAKNAGLEIVAHVMLGYPGETKETARKTIDLVKELDVDFAQFYCAVPFPGSKLYEDAEKEGVKRMRRKRG
jgi:radical SAM superfamily enzyme YgiQ (UPF0313 family)